MPLLRFVLYVCGFSPAYVQNEPIQHTSGRIRALGMYVYGLRIHIPR